MGVGVERKYHVELHGFYPVNLYAENCHGKFVEGNAGINVKYGEYEVVKANHTLGVHEAKVSIQAIGDVVDGLNAIFKDIKARHVALFCSNAQDINCEYIKIDGVESKYSTIHKIKTLVCRLSYVKIQDEMECKGDIQAESISAPKIYCGGHLRLKNSSIDNVFFTPENDNLELFLDKSEIKALFITNPKGYKIQFRGILPQSINISS